MFSYRPRGRLLDDFGRGLAQLSGLPLGISGRVSLAGVGPWAGVAHYCRDEMAQIPINIAELVGETPLVGLPRLLRKAERERGVELFAKLESRNPGGSVKDRIGVAMIEAAEAEGQIAPGRTTIVEATSGNTGIALALVCAAKGYELVLTLPQGMSRERESLLALYGARVQITESLGGMSEAVAAARELERGDDVFLPDQFSNPANPAVHRRTTGPEIARALEDRVDVLVAGVGTGGTITGAGEYLRERNPDLRIVAVEPRGSAVLSGGPVGPHRIQGIGAGFVPPVLKRELLDEVLAVSDDDAIQTAWRCARRTGLLAGISGGAALWAALQVAARAESGAQRIVVVVPDSGERYVSQAFFAP
jgi:cysteine synthase A